MSDVRITFNCIRDTAIHPLPVSAILEIESGDNRDIKAMLDAGVVMRGKHKRIIFTKVSETRFLTVDGTHDMVKYQYVKEILGDDIPFILSHPIRWDKQISTYNEC